MKKSNIFVSFAILLLFTGCQVPADGDDFILVEVGSPSTQSLSVSFREESVSFNERDVRGEIIVDFDQAATSGGEFSIIATGGGTASQGSDYILNSGSSSITYQAGESSKVIQIEILSDSLIEETEFVNLTLIGAGGIDVLANNTLRVEIFDNAQNQDLAAERFKAALVVLQSQCINCHMAVSHMQWGDLKTEEDWLNATHRGQRLVNGDDPQSSSILRGLRQEGGSMPLSNPDAIEAYSDRHHEILKEWITRINE